MRLIARIFSISVLALLSTMAESATSLDLSAVAVNTPAVDYVLENTPEGQTLLKQYFENVDRGKSGLTRTDPRLKEHFIHFIEKSPPESQWKRKLALLSVSRLYETVPPRADAALLNWDRVYLRHQAQRILGKDSQVGPTGKLATRAQLSFAPAMEEPTLAFGKTDVALTESTMASLPIALPAPEPVTPQAQVMVHQFEIANQTAFKKVAPDSPASFRKTLAQDLIEKAKATARELNIPFQTIQLDGKYPAIQFLADDKSRLGRLAQGLDSQLGATSLVYSPEFLMAHRAHGGFYSPTQSVLLPPTLFSQSSLSPTEAHEVLHAKMEHLRLSGVLNEFHGRITTRIPETLKTPSSYARAHMNLDELATFSISLEGISRPLTRPDKLNTKEKEIILEQLRSYLHQGENNAVFAEEISLHALELAHKNSEVIQLVQEPIKDGNTLIEGWVKVRMDPPGTEHILKIPLVHLSESQLKEISPTELRKVFRKNLQRRLDLYQEMNRAFRFANAELGKLAGAPLSAEVLARIRDVSLSPRRISRGAMTQVLNCSPGAQLKLYLNSSTR